MKRHILLQYIFILIWTKCIFTKPEFKCIQQNNYDSMRCSWDADNSTCWKLTYKVISEDVSDYNSFECLTISLSRKEASCLLVYNAAGGGYIQFAKYTFFLRECNNNNETYTYLVSTTTDRNVLMDPVVYIKVMDINSFDTKVRWRLPMFPLSAHETKQIDCNVTAAEGSKSTSEITSTAEQSLSMMYMVSNLTSCTIYTFGISCKVAKSRYWSDMKSIEVMTKAAVPRLGPRLLNGFFTTYRCKTKLNMIIYWQSTLDETCEMKTFIVVVNALGHNLHYNASTTGTAAAFSLPFYQETEFLVEVWTANNEGISESPTSIRLPSFTSTASIRPSKTEVTYTGNGTYNVSTFVRHVDVVVTYYWCYGDEVDQFGVICKSDIYFENGTTDARWKILRPIQDKRYNESKLMFGVSTYSDGVYSGIGWGSNYYDQQGSCHFKENMGSEVNKTSIWVPVTCVSIVIGFCLLLWISRQIYKYRRYDVSITLPEIHG